MIRFRICIFGRNATAVMLVFLNAAVYFQVPSLTKRNEGSLEKCLILRLDREGPDVPGISCCPESKDMLKGFQEPAWRATSIKCGTKY